jgi:methyl-accepting chemotaxis protein
VKLDDSTNVGINIKWLIQIVVGVGAAVTLYFTIMSALSKLEIETMRHNQEIELNSEFRIKWPRGEMGSLPDDAEQNLRLNHLERDVGQLQELVDELRQKDCD